jgi:hypothetical protein
VPRGRTPTSASKHCPPKAGRWWPKWISPGFGPANRPPGILQGRGQPVSDGTPHVAHGALPRRHQSLVRPRLITLSQATASSSEHRGSALVSVADQHLSRKYISIAGYMLHATRTAYCRTGTALLDLVHVRTVFLVRMKVASRELPYFGCRVAVLDPKFAQESESGLKSAQSPAGKDENCMQSPVSWAVWPAGRLAAGWQPCISR